MMADDEPLPINCTAVAIDKDKYSHYAVKWAIDHLLTGNNLIILVHVKLRNLVGVDTNQIFIPYRGFCARKSVQVREVILEDSQDVARALLDYVNGNMITNIVLGASNRSSFMRTFKKADVPSCLTKSAPDFCSVYVIGKSKVLSVRSAQRPAANTATPPKQPAQVLIQHQHSSDHLVPEDATPRLPSVRVNMGGDRGHIERSSDSIRSGRGRPQPVNLFKNPCNLSMDSIDILNGPGSNYSCISEEDSIMDAFATMRKSLDATGNNLDFSFVEPRKEEVQSPSAHDLEAEMRRLRLELKQTMDMYSTACREAISAKQKAKELNEWKMEELRRYENSRHYEESAMAIVEMEKAKCRAAMEAAEAAQKLAEKEAQKRKLAEMKAKRESEEKTRALTQLSVNDVRYRKYTIGEIEIATEKFDPNFKVGEGGYGPVYRGILDHTPVAIKVLRPDAAQGRKQFQQEVEVLSCMRHPHMVLLLGACPEYGCLVYEYMNNGSLEDRLLRRNKTPPIPWRIRFKIAAEIATGLSFLHQAKPEPLVHRDLKPANILLDRNYVSKISDVGLARLVPPSVADSVTQYHMTSAAGTFCYIDPEYQQTGMLNTKSDVYSFGILLLQIITARPPMGLSHHVQRAIDQGTLAQMLDPTVQDWPLVEATIFAKLALKCCELRKRDRPDLSKVILPELCQLRDFGMNDDADSYFYQPSQYSHASRSRMGQGNSYMSSNSHLRPHTNQVGSG